jgi:hypothetical protein
MPTFYRPTEEDRKRWRKVLEVRGRENARSKTDHAAASIVPIRGVDRSNTASFDFAADL